MHRRLQRISKEFHILGRNDVPDVSGLPCGVSGCYLKRLHSWALQSVYQFIQQEYTRACLITYESRPKGGFQEGWGRPGTNLEGVRFRTALLDTVREIGAFTCTFPLHPISLSSADKLAHLVIPRHPPLGPQARMLQHFRFIVPLLNVDDDGLTPLQYYDSAIQLARHAAREPTEHEYLVGMAAATEIKNR